MTVTDISVYNNLRNAMLKKQDPEELIKFMRRHKLNVPGSYAMAEVTLHKTITSVNSLPMDLRVKSKKWLLERGYTPLDDGDIKVD